MGIGSDPAQNGALKKVKFLLEEQVKSATKVTISNFSKQIQRRKLKKKIVMDPKLTEVSQHFERFKAALVRHDYDSCNNLLSQLKVILFCFRTLIFFRIIPLFTTSL